MFSMNWGGQGLWKRKLLLSKERIVSQQNQTFRMTLGMNTTIVAVVFRLGE